MSRKYKAVTMVKNPFGYTVKAWINRKTEEVFPTNWKIQALHLAGSVTITKRMENRRKRKVAARETYFKERHGMSGNWLAHQARQAVAQ